VSPHEKPLANKFFGGAFVVKMIIGGGPYGISAQQSILGTHVNTPKFK